MENYWSDSHFSNGGISILADEVTSLKSKLAGDSLKLRMFDILENACNHLRKAQQSTFLIADWLIIHASRDNNAMYRIGLGRRSGLEDYW